MNFLKLKDYGSVLTGREFGHQVYKTLEKNITYPVALDFENIESMGSSFGEELAIRGQLLILDRLTFNLFSGYHASFVKNQESTPKLDALGRAWPDGC